MILPVDFYQPWIMGKKDIYFPIEQPENVITVFSYFGELCSPVYICGELVREVVYDDFERSIIALRSKEYHVLMAFQSGRMEYIDIKTFGMFAKFHEYIPREHQEDKYYL